MMIMHGAYQIPENSGMLESLNGIEFILPLSSVLRNFDESL